MKDFIIANFNYWVYVILMMIGLYAMISKNNLVKKLIGMSIFQTAIILFYVSIGVKTGGTIPIIQHHAALPAETSVRMALLPEAHAADAKTKPHQDAGSASNKHPEPEHQSAIHGDEHAIHAKDYNNPLPHVLMLTAIVVGVATLGLGLAVVQKIYLEYGTTEESEILALIRQKGIENL